MESKADEKREGTVEARYNKLEALRHPYLIRARECSALTIPMLIPPMNNNRATKYKTPYQSLGARGVNGLANKLVLALLNTPFFKLSMDDATMQLISQEEDIKTKVDEAFGRIEMAISREIDTAGMRTKVVEAIKHLIVGGNVLVTIEEDLSLRTFPLSRYVVRRDAVGNLLLAITKEDISPLELKPEVRIAHQITEDTKPLQDQVIHLFTCLEKEDDGSYSVYQELNGKEVDGSRGTYTDKVPWMALRWIAVENEDYGRGHVEEYLGDLKSYEGLSKAILAAAAAAARVIYFLNPNSTTSKRRLIEAESGAVLEGNIGDVGILQLDKYADLKTAMEKAETLKRDLSAAFMLNSAIQRDGERVTAEEIRYMAQDLESSLGGVYSTLSQEFQQPLVKNLLFLMGTKKLIPILPNTVKPIITTGIEALGRGRDLDKFNQLFGELQVLGQAVGPEAIAARLNVGDAISRVATAIGIDTKGLIKDDTQVAAEQQQQHEMEMQQQMAPQVASAAMQQAQ